MTDAEKKRMLAVVRATEYLFSENLALKTVLLSHGVPQHIWEPESNRLMNDPELSPMVRARFQRLYAEIEQAHDEEKAVQELLTALPKPKKDWRVARPFAFCAKAGDDVQQSQPRSLT